MKQLYLVLLCMGFIFFHTNVKAQPPQLPKASLAPNSANLGLFGDVPVSLYTGTPQINIPLYELKVKDFTLPISLNYHASGVRIDQRPGWVGLGWTLFAGGSIIRKVNDLPDEEAHDRLAEVFKKMGYYYNYKVLDDNLWNEREYLRNVAQDDNKSIFKDTEPDEFSFYFPGYNGKFYLDHKGKWVVQCNKPVKVEFDGKLREIPFRRQGTQAENHTLDYFRCFDGFTITTEDGAKYIFGKDDNSTEYSMSFFKQYNSDWIATAWNLTKIVLPSQHEIKFMYGRGDYINQLYITKYIELKSSTTSNGDIFSDYKCATATTLSPNIDQEQYNGSLIAPSYLVKIYSDDIHIHLDRNVSSELNYTKAIYDKQQQRYWAGLSNFSLSVLENKDVNNIPKYYPDCLEYLKPHKLNSILIEKLTSETEIPDVLKKIYFNYSNTTNQRLVLSSITEAFGARNIRIPSYQFSYYNIDKLPGYLSGQADHWGFYNGKKEKNPDSMADVNLYYDSREPNSGYTLYGMLDKIVYPTGGYTKFEYEPHYYKKQLKEKRWEGYDDFTDNKLAGGARIKKIISCDSENGIEKTTKEYKYVTNYLQDAGGKPISSGVLGGKIKYLVDDYSFYVFNDGNKKKKKTIFSSVSQLPSCQNINESYIGYTEVIELNPDNSFTRYLFTNFDNGYLDEPADAVIQASSTPYEPYASKAMERGQLILLEDYNDKKKKVRSKSFVYDRTSSKYVRSMKASYNNICSDASTSISYDEGSSYKIYTYSMSLKQETETYYNSTSPHGLAIDKKYTYNAYNLLTSEIVEDSKGSLHKKEYKYPSDYNSLPYTDMVQKNILSPIVETSQYINGGFMQKEKIDYKNWGNNIFAPEFYKTQNRNQSSLETRITYHNYDSYGNPIYVTKDNAEHLVYIWSYFGKYIVAEIKNATYQQVKDNFFYYYPENVSKKKEPDETESFLIKDLRNTLPQALVDTYTYNILYGMVSATNPRNLTTYYVYDSLGRLIEIYQKPGMSKEVLEKYEYNYKKQQ